VQHVDASPGTAPESQSQADDGSPQLRASRQLRHLPIAGPHAAAPAARYTPSADAIGWTTGALAIVAGLGWMLERRRRRRLELEHRPPWWAGSPPHGAPAGPTEPIEPRLDFILPDDPDPDTDSGAGAAGEPTLADASSPSEATLLDLHQLRGELQRLRECGDHEATLQALQQHLLDFRRTSPWVFLELLATCKALERPVEWELAREPFRKRFGQNAPLWSAPSTEAAEFADDPHLREELEGCWPYREARVFVLRWMLGEPATRERCCGPPLLPLGVYRDILLLDSILDAVMVARPQAAGSLL
jgi:hypothetical protein